MRIKICIKSAGGAKKQLTEFKSKAEAENFCKANDWKYVDENDFVWDMDYEEDRR